MYQPRQSEISRSPHAIVSGAVLLQRGDFDELHAAMCVKLAREYAGSRPFMAPEVLRKQRVRQTSKVDVWSLFAILGYAIDAAEYRKTPVRTIE
jgi:serine/threonine protein kinase